MKRPPKSDKVKCTETKADGSLCGAWAIPDSDPPRCPWHSGSAEDRSRRARRAAQMGALKRRGDVEARPSSGIDPGVTLEQVLAIVTPALSACFEHDGSPDWGARLLAVGVLVSAFPRYYRETPEQVRELIAAILPAEYIDPERLEAQRVYSNLRREWDELGIAYGDLKGLYVKPYPASFIAPWEDAARVQASRPAPIPPAEAEEEIVRYPEGQIALKRKDGVPRLIEWEPPEVPD